VELHVETPILALYIFKNMRFTLSIICAFLIFITGFFFNVISPFYLENTLGLPANYAGYTLMIYPLINVVTAPVAGAISDKIGSEKLT
ncbi:MFS transporter, partial [Lactiplantibacillus plantarum]